MSDFAVTRAAFTLVLLESGWTATALLWLVFQHTKPLEKSPSTSAPRRRQRVPEGVDEGVGLGSCVGVQVGDGKLVFGVEVNVADAIPPGTGVRVGVLPVIGVQVLVGNGIGVLVAPPNGVLVLVGNPTLVPLGVRRYRTRCLPGRRYWWGKAC